MTSSVWLRLKRPRPRTAALLAGTLACLVPAAGTIAAQATGPTKGRPGPINVKGAPDLVVSPAMGITPYRLASTCTATNPLLTFFLQVANRGTGPSPAQPATMLVAEDVGLSPPWTGQAALPAIDPGKVVSVTLPVMVYSPPAAVTGTDTFTFAVRSASSPTRANAGTSRVMLVLTIPPGLCTSALGHRPVPDKPAPPGSITQDKTAPPRAPLNRAERAALASKFSATEFRTQVLKSGKIVKAPIITVSHKPQAAGSLQIHEIPVTEREQVTLTGIPVTEITLAGPSGRFQAFTTSLYAPPYTRTSHDSIWVPAVVVSKIADGINNGPRSFSHWDSSFTEVFSFKKLAPGFQVTGFQVIPHDLDSSYYIETLCLVAQSPLEPDFHIPFLNMRGHWYTRVRKPKPLDGDPFSNQSLSAHWDDSTQSLRVYTDGWTCELYDDHDYHGTPMMYMGNPNATYLGSIKAMVYDVYVWVTGPKGKSPWGGKIIRVP